jgi:pimeloyl-ACP methyl ester carboxylesterase
MRWRLADPDPAYAEAEARIQANPVILAPTLVLHGGADPCTQPSTSEGKEKFFSGPYERHVIAGARHFVQRQMPERVAHHILHFFEAHT